MILKMMVWWIDSNCDAIDVWCVNEDGEWTGIVLAPVYSYKEEDIFVAVKTIASNMLFPSPALLM